MAKVLFLFKRLGKKALWGTLSVIVISLPIIYILLINASKTEAAWFNDNWLYRKAITVTVTSSSSDIRDLETLLTIDTTGITDKLQTSCQDLRFTNVNGDTLPYYIDSCSDNSATNKVWVMADLVPKNTTTYTLYMYYGNPSAGTASDSTNFWRFRDLEGYWTLNDTSGDRTDSSVNGLTLTDNNTVTSNTGQYSNAGQFTAANSESLSIADNASLSMGSSVVFTLSSWVYLDSKSAAGGIIEHQVFANDRSYALAYQSSTDRFGFFATNTSNNWDTSVLANNLGSPSTGTWYFVVAWYDGSTVNIQVNNGTIDSTTYSSGVRNGGGTIRLGSDSNGTGDKLDGRLDDVRVYKRVLTADERAQLYTNPGTIATTAVGTSQPSTSFATEEQAPAPTAYWKFDDGTGTTAQDSTSNNSDGTISGATWQTEDQCVTGKCLSFDGTNDQVTTNLQISPAQYSSITLATWLNPSTQNSGGQTFKCIICGDDGNYDRGFGINTSTGKYIIQVGNTTWEPVSYNANNWQYAALVYTSSSITFYLNGTAYSYGSGGSFGTSTQPLQIGEDSACGDCYFTGKIDETKVYNYPRTAAQIKSDYDSRGSVKGTSIDLGSDPQNNAVLSNGLLGYYKAEQSSWDGTSNEVVDSSGNTNHGTAVNGATTAAGKFGNAGSFDGTNDYVNLSNPTSLQQSGVITLSAWVKSTASVSDGNVRLIVGNWKSSSRSNYGLFWTGQPSGAQGLTFHGGNRAVYVSAANSAGYRDGNWHHMVGVLDNNNIRLYVDGVLVAENTHTSFTISNTTDTWEINSTTSWTAWAATIDETRIYNRAFTAADVAALYNFAPGPVGYWDLNENTGTSAFDRSGNGNTGTWQGTLGSQWSQAKHGSGGKFNGSNNVISISDHASLKPNVITVSAWFNTTNKDIQQDIISKTQAGSYNLWFNNSGSTTGCVTGTLCFIVHNGTNYTGAGYAVSNLSNNTWYHVAGTFDGSTVKLYVNGTLQASTSFSGTFTHATSPVCIGGEPDADDCITDGSWFNGQIDDAKIYNYARNQQQIVSDMNAGHPAVGSPIASAVGHWKFDEGADNTCSGGTNDTCNSGNGGSTLDGAGSGFASPATTTSGWTNYGKFGKALIFDGSNDNISLTDTTALRPSVLTISAWVYTSSTTQIGCIVCKQVGSSFNNSYALYANSGKATMMVQTSGGTSVTSADPSDMPLNTWTHYVGVYDGSKTYLYKNGVLLDSDSGSITIGYDSNPTLIGADSNDGTPGAEAVFWTGSIDEPKIYSYALTADQVKQDMNQGQAQVLGALSSGETLPNHISDLRLWLRADALSLADGDAVTTWTDSSLQINNASQSTAGSKPTFKTNILNGKPVIRFDGGDYMTLSSQTTLTSQQFTIFAVVNDTNGAGGHREIFSNWNSGNTTSSLFFGRTTSNVLRFSDDFGSAGTWTSVSTHAILTAVSESSNARTYQNGTLLASKGSALSSRTLSGFDYEIGRQGAAGENWIGDMAEIIVFNKALNTTERQGIETYLANKYGTGVANVSSPISKTAANQEFCIPGDNSLCNGPVGEWKFDEKQGTSARDTSANGYTGTVTGATWTQGKVGQALSFDGSDDFVDVGTASSSIKTVSFWVKPTTTTEYPIDINGTAYIWINAGTVTAQGFTSPTIYINGIASSTATAGVWQYVTVVTDTALNGSDFDIGRIEGVGNHEGQIDQVRVFNYVRSGSQVRWDYDRGAPSAYWNLDECQGTQLYDSARNANGASMGNTATITIGASGEDTLGTCSTSSTAWGSGAAGKYNYSLDFDGTDDYVTLPSTTYFTDTFAISMWVYPDNTNSGNAVWVRGRDGGSGRVTLDSTGTVWRLQEAAGSNLAISGGTVTANTWTHLVAIINGNTVQIYQNSKLVATGDIDHAIDAGGGTQRHYFGRGENIAAAWDGKIDDVKIFRYPLNATQIKELTNSGAVRFGPVTESP